MCWNLILLLFFTSIGAVDQTGIIHSADFSVSKFVETLIIILIGGGLTLLFAISSIKALGILRGTHVVYGRFGPGKGIEEQDSCDYCSMFFFMILTGCLALFTFILTCWVAI